MSNFGKADIKNTALQGQIANRETSILGGGGRVQRQNFSIAIGGSVEEKLKEEREKCVWWFIFPFFPSLPSHNY